MLSSILRHYGISDFDAQPLASGLINRTWKVSAVSGTFILQHNGVMKRGEGQLTVTIVPDSGTDQLEGISGTLQINIVDGKHFYEIEYTL